MLLAAVAVTPFALGSALPAFSQPVLLLAGAGVGICSSVIPYVTDQLAMARLPRATFALMLALLPMFATVIGAIVLHQVPTAQDLAGIALVVAGVAVHHPERGERRDRAVEPRSAAGGCAGRPPLPGQQRQRCEGRQHEAGTFGGSRQHEAGAFGGGRQHEAGAFGGGRHEPRPGTLGHRASHRAGHRAVKKKDLPDGAR
jgi:hypothetical protein